VDVVVVDIAVSVEALAVVVVAAALLQDTITPSTQVSKGTNVLDVTTVQAASVKFSETAQFGPQVNF
jgi:hypothetical protein